MIPAESMKMRTPLIVSLARQTLDVLKALRLSPATTNGYSPVTSTPGSR